MTTLVAAITVTNIASFHTVVVCPTLLNPMEGRVALTGTLVGSQAAYSCNEGLVLNGNRTRICRADGRWSGSEPTCDTPPGMAKQMQNDPVAFMQTQ